MDWKRSLEPTYAEYEAAVREFDRLWESGTAQPSEKKMESLMAVIEAFEQRDSFSACYDQGDASEGRNALLEIMVRFHKVA